VALEVLALFDVFLADVELHVWTAHLYSTSQKTYRHEAADRTQPGLRARCEFREGTSTGRSSSTTTGVIEFHTRSSGKGGRGFPGVEADHPRRVAVRQTG
jgi:hypothetical protein